VSDALLIARYGLREALRKRVFIVVLLLTAAFLVLYWLGVSSVVAETNASQGLFTDSPVDATALIGATIFGLAMFATLFLGAVLAVFLTLGVVRGDAERGLLQPLVVRPVGRTTLLLARLGGAASASALYVLVVYLLAMLITAALLGWWPDRPVVAGLELALCAVLISAVAVLGSVFLSPVANGIAAFMFFGAGLLSGLLGQVGEALDSETLETVASAASYLLPFEALYQDALNGLVADASIVTSLALNLGPFGGADAGGPLVLVWAFVYVGLVTAAAVAGFRRRDL
jgi:ABC-type transport system involved in multi-copper enzyme maturation permease subunit